MIRLMIVEDNEIVKGSLESYFNQQDGLTVIATAGDGTIAAQLLGSGILCDVILTDLNMPRMDGLQLTDFVANNYPSIPTVISTMSAQPDIRELATFFGATAIISKSRPISELLYIIRRVANGEILI